MAIRPTSFPLDTTRELKGHTTSASHRPPDFAGKHRVGNDFLDVKIVLSLAPAQIHDPRIKAHGFECLSIPDAGGDQQRIADGTNELWLAPKGMTYRAKDGGEKKLGGENFTDKDHVLVIRDPRSGSGKLRIRCKHGIEVASITPDTNKNGNQPLAQVALMFKGIDAAEFGDISWRAFTEELPMVFSLERKDQGELVADEKDAKALAAAQVAQTKKKENPKQAKIEDGGKEARVARKKEGLSISQAAAQSKPRGEAHQLKFNKPPAKAAVKKPTVKKPAVKKAVAKKPATKRPAAKTPARKR